MKFLHWEGNVSPENVIRVDLGSAANVQLLDDVAYATFRRGTGNYRYQGGYFKRTPVVFQVPRTARWHVVVHLGGHAGRVSASVAVA